MQVRETGVPGGGGSTYPRPRGRRDCDKYRELSEGPERLELENEMNMREEGDEDEDKEEEVGGRQDILLEQGGSPT